MEQSHARCGAKTRSGEPCKNAPMPNGRCRMHGGKAGAPKENKNARKHGFYESLVRDRLSEEQKNVYDQIPSDESLKEELRILRYKLLRLLDPLEKQVVIGSEMGAQIETIEIDEVTKAYAIEKITDGIRKIIKDMKDTDAEDDSLLELVSVIEKSRKSRQ